MTTPDVPPPASVCGSAGLVFPQKLLMNCFSLLFFFFCKINFSLFFVCTAVKVIVIILLLLLLIFAAVMEVGKLIWVAVVAVVVMTLFLLLSLFVRYPDDTGDRGSSSHTSVLYVQTTKTRVITREYCTMRNSLLIVASFPCSKTSSRLTPSHSIPDSKHINQSKPVGTINSTISARLLATRHTHIIQQWLIPIPLRCNIYVSIYISISIYIYLCLYLSICLFNTAITWTLAYNLSQTGKTPLARDRSSPPPPPAICVICVICVMWRFLFFLKVWDIKAGKFTEVNTDGHNIPTQPIQSLSMATNASMIVGANNKGMVYVFKPAEDTKVSGF